MYIHPHIHIPSASSFHVHHFMYMYLVLDYSAIQRVGSLVYLLLIEFIIVYTLGTSSARRIGGTEEELK